MTDAGYSRKLVDGVAVVSTSAEIDITVSGQLRAVLLEAITSEHPVLVVDMTGTRFCDSAGIHTLVQASERARAEGGELRLLIAPGGTVPRILQLTGIDRIIRCFASLAEALAPAADPDRCHAAQLPSQSRRTDRLRGPCACPRHAR